MIFKITASSLSVVRLHLNVSVVILKRMKCESRFSDSPFSELRCELAHASRQTGAETTSTTLIFPQSTSIYDFTLFTLVAYGSKETFTEAHLIKLNRTSLIHSHICIHTVIPLKDAIYSNIRCSALLLVNQHDCRT